MLDAWHEFKICGPIEIDHKKAGYDYREVVWVIFGQRHDGAVFWSTVSILGDERTDFGSDFAEVFWVKAGIIFQRFEERFSHEEASEKSYVAFKDVGIWFKDEDGHWYFK